MIRGIQNKFCPLAAFDCSHAAIHAELLILLIFFFLLLSTFCMHFPVLRRFLASPCCVTSRSWLDIYVFIHHSHRANEIYPPDPSYRRVIDGADTGQVHLYSLITQRRLQQQEMMTMTTTMVKVMWLTWQRLNARPPNVSVIYDNDN